MHEPPHPLPILETLPKIGLPNPTEDPSKDAPYLIAIETAANKSNTFTANVNAKKLGYGGNPAMTGPPPGSVPPGAIVRGAQWKATDASGLGGIQI